MMEVVRVTNQDRKRLENVVYLGKEGWFIAESEMFLFDREYFKVDGTLVYKDENDGVRKSAKATLEGWLDKPLGKGRIRVGDVFRAGFLSYRVEVKGNGRS